MSPKKIFINQHLISKVFFCSICYEVFQRPSRLYCGHVYCYDCIYKCARKNFNRCPICKQPTLINHRYNPDYTAANWINEQPSQCSYQQCTWKGPYQQFKKHKRLCQYRIKQTVQPKWSSIPNLIVIQDENSTNQNRSSSLIQKNKNDVIANQTENHSQMIFIPSHWERNINNIIKRFKEQLRRQILNQIYQTRPNFIHAQQQDIPQPSHFHQIIKPKPKKQQPFIIFKNYRQKVIDLQSSALKKKRNTNYIKNNQQTQILIEQNKFIESQIRKTS